MNEFGWEVRDGVGFVTLVGAERKNPLTFASYAALRDHFRALAYDDEVDAVVITGEGGDEVLAVKRGWMLATILARRGRIAPGAYRSALGSLAPALVETS